MSGLRDCALSELEKKAQEVVDQLDGQGFHGTISNKNGKIIKTYDLSMDYQFNARYKILWGVTSYSKNSKSYAVVAVKKKRQSKMDVGPDDVAEVLPEKDQSLLINAFDSWKESTFAGAKAIVTHLFGKSSPFQFTQKEISTIKQHSGGSLQHQRAFKFCGKSHTVNINLNWQKNQENK